MNYQQYIESFKEVHPAYLEVRFRDMLNQAIAEFAEDSFVLWDEQDLTPESDDITYLFPARTLRVDDVKLDGGTVDRVVYPIPSWAGNATATVWFMLDDHSGIQLGKLGEDDDGAGVLTLVTGTVSIERRYAPAPLTGSDTSEEPGFDSKYHEALSAKVKSRLYAAKENLQMATYWHAVYKNYLRRAKIEAMRRKGPRSVHVMLHEY